MTNKSGQAAGIGVRPAYRENTVQLRETSFDDYSRITGVLARNGLHTRTFDHWARLWTENPAYQSRGGPIGWVLETGKGEIVGTIANIPGRYRLRGQDVISASAADWAVDEPYRRYSLMLLEALTRQRGVDLLLCTTVSVASEPAFQPFGWTKVPAGTWDAADYWITNYQGFVAAALKRKRIPLARTAAFAVSGALYCIDRCRSGVAGRNNQISVECCSQIDGRFDELWSNLESARPETLMAVRTRDALGFCLKSMLSTNTGWVLACSEAGKMVGYAIFERDDNQKHAFTRVRTVDLQALPGHERALQSAFFWMSQKCRQQRVHVIENPGCWLGLAGLPGLGPARRRKLPSWSFYYKALKPGLAEELKAAHRWRPSLLDGDSSLGTK